MAFSRPVGIVALLMAVSLVWLVAGVASLRIGRLDVPVRSAGELALVAGWIGPLVAALGLYRHRRRQAAPGRQA
ncbi:hypothetical protein [Pseudoxanthomonas kaohsiungensis]|uniref:Uncharacterized protein n=1 Tax=Pseudoxanthomonas kaohsiungensis TaxID=283923 RepID=A0ABW3M1P9_9GAMM|nr:hypothetical protein [Pseudoxanthomonas kaohsiungensis]KAF1700826.1 hypothetical protein CSC66_14795 [Pseudoxanthomonas kaohsiungensis]